MPSQLVRMAQTLDGKTIFVREDREDGAVRGTKGRSPRAGAEPGSGAFRGGGARPSHPAHMHGNLPAARGLSASPKTWEGCLNHSVVSQFLVTTAQAARAAAEAGAGGTARSGARRPTAPRQAAPF